MTLINTDWRFRNLQVVRLENEELRVDILPDVGAKIYSFIHKTSGREMLWRNPRLLPERQVYGASFDDNWSGGWDELLPNDLPRPTPDGELLPDHGEAWSQAAEWEILRSDEKTCSVRFVAYGRVLATRFEKIISIEAGAPFIRIHYIYANLGGSPVDFLWNIHPALAVTPSTWLDLPASNGLTDPWREKQFMGNTTFTWPLASNRSGWEVDLRRVPPASPDIADMHYLLDVQDGWYAATDTQTQTGFALRFPREVFPHVWLFRALGGWRGLYTLILEPSTGYPYDLEVARRNGTCAHLEPGASLETDVLAIAYSGAAAVAGVSADGEVRPESGLES